MELTEAIQKAHEKIGGIGGIYSDLHKITRLAEDVLKDAQWSRAVEIRNFALSAKNKLDNFALELVEFIKEKDGEAKCSKK